MKFRQLFFSADGFVVQTGDPEGPAEGFIDPSTEKPRTIPLEIMAVGEKAPFYGATLEVSFKLSVSCCIFYMFVYLFWCFTTGVCKPDEALVVLV